MLAAATLLAPLGIASMASAKVILASQSISIATSTDVNSNAPLTLTTAGASGTGKVSFMVTDAGSAGCSVKKNVLSSTGAGTCTVTATVAHDTVYAAATSAPVTFTFAGCAGVEVATQACPYVSTLVSESGLAPGTGLLDDTALADDYFIWAYYNPGCTLFESYIKPGANLKMSWSVKLPNGLPAASTNVVLVDNLAYGQPPTYRINWGKKQGTAAGQTGLNADPTTQGNWFEGGTMAGMTNAKGVVSFNLTNANTAAQTATAQNQTTPSDPANWSSPAFANEGTGSFPYTRFGLSVGTPSSFAPFTGGGANNTDQTTLFDTIVTN
jgi:hypothetical protein